VPQLPAFSIPTMPFAGWGDSAQSMLADAADRGRAFAAEMRRRFSFELATKHDVAVQGRLTRQTLAHTLNQFLDGQHAHDSELVESVRAEVRELLQSLIAALDDDVYDAPLGELDDADDLDLVPLDAIAFDDEDAALRYE
jgi:hypothetical protein